MIFTRPFSSKRVGSGHETMPQATAYAGRYLGDKKNYIVLIELEWP